MKPKIIFARNLNTVFLSMALIVMVLTVFIQLGNHEFLNYDDTTYVTENPHVSSGITSKNIIWAFTSVEAANWHPITWLSHMADVQLYGKNPRGHHLTSVVIHAISSVLLLLFLSRFTGSLWQSSFVATLFAIHPLHVESVAWVAERKDVLSTFFWFLTLLLYSEYVTKLKPALYILALFSFVLGLMSKPMLVTLPLVMLLMDFWPFGRYQHEDQEQESHQLVGRALALIKEKIPFFACSVLSGIVTIYAQHKGEAIRGLDDLPFILRIENALIAYIKYIAKTFWPHDLAVPYPMPSSFPLWQIIGSLLVLLLVSATAIRVGRRFPYLLVGWFWFLITLLPVIGFIKVGEQAMADRYTYIPVIGLFILAGWGIPELTKDFRYRKVILSLLAGVSIVASIALTWQQLGYWKNGTSLFRHTIQVTTGNSLAHYYLGIALSDKGDLDTAIKEYQEALRINPNFADVHYNMGNELANRGDLNAAIIEYQEALRINPNHVRAHNNLGTKYFKIKNIDEAIQEYREALRINPNFSEAHSNMGFAFASKGSLDAAILEHQEALKLDPNNAKMHRNLGIALYKKGNLDDTILEFRKALEITPNDSEAHNNLGYALAHKGYLDAAIQEYQEALRLNPNNATAQNNLESAIAKKMDTRLGNK